MNMLIFLPELALMTMALVLFFASLASWDFKRLYGLTLAMSATAVVCAVASWGQEGTLFFGAYRVDAFSQLFKIFITMGLFVVLAMGEGLSGIEKRLQPEYFFFVTVSSTGLVFLTSAVELITIFISLEVSSFALYVVIPFRKAGAQHREQMEAGIKYVLFGALSSGISLFGMSYVFGLAHTTYLSELATVVPGLLTSSPMLIVGLVMMLAGFFFKLAMFPMHFWAPDVYQGAANETAGFVATIPKAAAVALLIRFISLAGGVDLGDFNWILAAFAVFSMVLGNLSALVQEDVKRLLAYSSIAHAGYVMVALLCVNLLGFSTAIYYIAGYMMMNLACFYVVYHVGQDGENVTLDNLAGLYKRSPLLALVLAVGAFGMAGIPPTVGFFGKFFVFTAAIQKSLYALVIITVINAGISAFYYLKLVRAAYSPVKNPGETLTLGKPASLLGVALMAAILLVGIFPQFFMEVAEKAVGTLM
ncbi:NADH-quinone oxidoreductase subunit N [Desulfoluna sp.]|uniref:NADH-quinone oxidoreductase subunit N n=1 Tax=Desulfoluna sp. TaxID=2045199 RepID=UPI002612C618|nr:NADH-quinone oxidoreductase subunit N [Desulfoluna sp.]